MTEAIQIELKTVEAIGVVNMHRKGDAKPVEYRQALADKVHDQYKQEREDKDA